MAEPVAWGDDGTPRSPRFDDIYRSESGGLAQARHVFLEGSGLPAAFFVDVGKRHREALAREGGGRGFSDSRTRAGDERDFAGCSIGHGLSPNASRTLGRADRPRITQSYG